MDTFNVKDRILENISASVKRLQSCFSACDKETPIIRNHHHVLLSLCEHLDHALLYGLQDISLGYWVLVLHLTRTEAVRRIEGLQNIRTHLGRSRAWLYLALSESSLECYLRLFQENQSLLHKYYCKHALVCSRDHLSLFLTLVSGLEFIQFDLDLDVPYLDVSSYMPEYYKPQDISDLQEPLPGVFLHSYNSMNMEWDDSGIAPCSEDGEFAELSQCHVSMATSDPLGTTFKKALQWPKHWQSLCGEEADVHLSADSTTVYKPSLDALVTTLGTNNKDLEVIRLSRRRKSTRRRSKGAKEPVPQTVNATIPECIPLSTTGETQRARSCDMWTGEDYEDGLFRLSDMTDSTMESRNLLLKDFMNREQGSVQIQRVQREHNCKSPNIIRLSPEPGGQFDHAGVDWEPELVPRSHNEKVEASSGPESPLKRGSLVIKPHPAEFRVDNNNLLLLMIYVFREAEEQLVKMVRMSTGHMEGDLQPLFLLMSDCHIYLLRKGSIEKPFLVDDSMSYTELDYISVGLDQQTVTLVSTNRRKQFLLDTGDVSLTHWLLDILKSVKKRSQEPLHPIILTDATVEKLSLTKFLCQVCNCEMSEVNIHLYALVHWEDSVDASKASSWGTTRPSSLCSVREGQLQYRVGTSYLGKELWKSCYLVLSDDVLYQYSDRADVTPLLSLPIGGVQCGGCCRSTSSEQPHCFQTLLTERPPLELAANSEQDMADWMQALCHAASKGMIPQDGAPIQCVPCCLVLTDRKLVMCHQDCQTGVFHLLGEAELSDVTEISVEGDEEYCIVEFAESTQQTLPPWVLYFSTSEERQRLQKVLAATWRDLFQVSLQQRCISDVSLKKRCHEALALIRSAWQRSDSLRPGRTQRETWC